LLLSLAQIFLSIKLDFFKIVLVSIGSIMMEGSSIQPPRNFVLAKDSSTGSSSSSSSSQVFEILNFCNSFARF
jgi:hypothetical protein